MHSPPGGTSSSLPLISASCSERSPTSAISTTSSCASMTNPCSVGWPNQALAQSRWPLATLAGLQLIHGNGADVAPIVKLVLLAFANGVDADHLYGTGAREPAQNEFVIELE